MSGAFQSEPWYIYHGSERWKYRRCGIYTSTNEDWPRMLDSALSLSMKRIQIMDSWNPQKTNIRP
jgi:hypothetical protein